MALAPYPDAEGSCQHTAVADNVDAVSTIAADAAGTNVLDWIAFGYDEDPDAGTFLIVAIGGTNKLKIPITAGGGGFIPFPRGMCNEHVVNQAIVVTLQAGGSGKGGWVSTGHH